MINFQRQANKTEPQTDIDSNKMVEQYSYQSSHLILVVIAQYKLIIKQAKNKKTMEVLISKQVNKENANSNLNKEVQRLRVQLNDKIFEINKLEEDYAQEKAKQFIDFQKERQSLNRNVKQLKEKLQMENQEWLKKVEEIRQKCIQNNQKTKEEYEQHLKQSQRALRQHYSSNFQQKIISLEKQLVEKQETFQKKFAIFQAEKQKEIELLRSFKQQVIQTNERTYQASLQTLKTQNQKHVKKLQNIYLSEKQAKQAIERQLQTYIQENVREKLAYEHKVDELKQQNSKLLCQIAELNKQVCFINQKLLASQKLKEESIRQLSVSKSKEIQKMVSDFSKRYEALSKNHQNQLVRIKAQINQICKVHQEKQKKWQQRGQMILKTIDNVQKKTDNSKVIKTLQTQLMKKDDLLQKQRQSLKNCKLQLENMEDIYDKMFVTNNYLYKFRSKSFKVKKMRVPNMLNHPNSSIFIEERIYTEGDK